MLRSVIAAAGVAASAAAASAPLCDSLDSCLAVLTAKSPTIAALARPLLEAHDWARLPLSNTSGKNPWCPNARCVGCAWWWERRHRSAHIPPMPLRASLPLAPFPPPRSNRYILAPRPAAATLS